VRRFRKLLRDGAATVRKKKKKEKRKSFLPKKFDATFERLTRSYTLFNGLLHIYLPMIEHLFMDV